MSQKQDNEASTGSIESYTTGFVLSVVLTVIAYIAIVNHVFTGWVTMAVIVSLALIQLLVQLIFFLHLGRESKPRWNLTVLLFMVLVVGIVVLGSLWIMNNLNYHETTLSPSEVETFIITDEGIKK